MSNPVDRKVVGPVHPFRGMKRFRRNASLLFDNGVLVATDRRCRSARFPLGAGAAAPAKLLEVVEGVKSLGQYAVRDGNDSTLIVMEDTMWDTDEIFDVFDAAGIVAAGASPPGPLRSDAIVLRDAKWPWSVAAATPVGLPLGMLAANHVIPIPLVIPYFVFVLGGAVAAWAGGFWAPPRDCQTMREMREIVAQGEAKRKAMKTAQKETHKRRSQ